MFTAIYLLCMQGMPCQNFIDNPYPSIETCEIGAEKNVAIVRKRAENGELPPLTVEYQCVSWVKA